MTSNVQNQILKLYTIDHLTVKKIAYKRKTTVQAVYKVLKELRKKGLINKGLKSTTTLLPGGFNRYFRLHGLQWDITIIDQGNIYHNARERGNIINLNSNTIVMYKDKIEIYLGKDISFSSETLEETFIQAFSYFNDLIYKLETRYNITLIKNGYHNISLCSGHLSEVNNEMAKDLYLTKDYITIYGTKDKKAWFKIDYSKRQYKEAETIHPKRFKEDAQAIFSTYLNDLRDNHPMTNSQLQEMIYLSNPILYIKRNIRDFNDIMKYEEEIRALGYDDRNKLSDWTFERFGT